MRADIIDLSHHDGYVNFAQMKAEGVVGVVLKATEGKSYTDPVYKDRYAEASRIFGPGYVHSYHFLTGDDAAQQVKHYLEVTDGKPGRWLDFERGKSQCSLETAVKACHLLAQKQGRFPGMYGSDGDLLGEAIISGHFAGVCPIWLARYSGKPPVHRCDLWQWQAGESDKVKIAGGIYDCSQFMPRIENSCARWMASLGNPIY